METTQLPSPERREQAQHHPAIILTVLFIVLAWALVFVVGIGISHGAWASWWALISLGAFTALVASVTISHEKYKAHQLHRQDLADREHHRSMVELAIRGDHSAEHITATSSFRTVSKFMGPASSVTIKDNQMGQLGAGSAAQPSLTTVIEDLSHNALELAYGLDPGTGQLVKTTLPKAVHIQLLGSTGMGKSRQATSILTQLCARNDTNHLQLALIDCEGETTEPFRGLPHVCAIADEPKAAAKALRGLVNELERRDVGKQVWPVILVFVEEFLNLRRIMPAPYRDDALEDYTTLALRGRKRGMFLFSIGQTSYTERAIRDAQLQFMSSMAFAIKPTAARASGFVNTELLNQLYAERKPGQFLLERPAGDAILLAPFVDLAAIPGLLTVESTLASSPFESQSKASRKPGRNQLDAALQAKCEQVRQLLLSGTTNKAEICLAVWGTRPGNSERYRQAEQEFIMIMQYLVASESEAS